MDDRTLTALRGSIEKWEKIVDGTGLDRAAANCPLCKEFYWAGSVGLSGGCEGCPVKEATGQRDCEGSPFKNWIASEGAECSRNDRGGYDLTAEQRVAAEAELAFLRSLLPAEA